MGLFTQLEKFDQKLTRGYARWGRWVWRTLIVVPVLVVLWNIGQAVWGGPRGGVILEIHSEIDRPILGFSVNGGARMLLQMVAVQQPVVVMLVGIRQRLSGH